MNKFSPSVNIPLSLFLKAACELISLWCWISHLSKVEETALGARLRSHNCFVSAIDSPELSVPRHSGRSFPTLPSIRGGKGDRQASSAEWGPLKQEGERAPRERAEKPWATRAPHFPVLPIEELWLFCHPMNTFVSFPSWVLDYIETQGRSRYTCYS